MGHVCDATIRDEGSLLLKCLPSRRITSRLPAQHLVGKRSHNRRPARLLLSILLPLQGQASLEPLLPNVKGMPIKVIGGTQALGRHGHVLNLVESHEVIVKVGGSELKVLPRPFVAVLCLPSA